MKRLTVLLSVFLFVVVSVLAASDASAYRRHKYHHRSHYQRTATHHSWASTHPQKRNKSHAWCKNNPKRCNHSAAWCNKYPGKCYKEYCKYHSCD